MIWCFTEHKHYTAYDYVEQILCERWQKYKSPLDFLKQNMTLEDLYTQLDIVEKENQDQVAMETSAKVEYIQQVATENESIEDFIEVLYLG